MGYVLPYKPSQALVVQWALVDIAYGIAFFGLLD
jgi:hypothetical protein